MDDLTVLLTAAGSPGASTCIRHLRGIRERRVRVIGVDADREAIGRGLCDGFHAVPPAASPEYPEALLEVARIEGPDVLIPASTFEIETVAPWTDRFEALGVRVLASRPEDLQLANDKHRLYAMFDGDPDVPVPAHRLVRSLEEFLAAVEELGAGGRRLCFKPPRSKGSRGFRYLDGRTSRRSLLLDHKPDNKVMSLEEFRAIFADDPDFPPLLVMEVLEGEEIDSMVIGHEGEALLITHKTRESERGGVITRGDPRDRPPGAAAVQLRHPVHRGRAAGDQPAALDLHVHPGLGRAVLRHQARPRRVDARGRAGDAGPRAGGTADGPLLRPALLGAGAGGGVTAQPRPSRSITAIAFRSHAVRRGPR